MEELVNKLAELQAELDKELINADFASAWVNNRMEIVKNELKELEEERTLVRHPYIEAAEELKTTIGDLYHTIIDEWDGEKNTMAFDTGTLKFRTTKALKIVDGGRLLEHIIENTSIDEAVNKYLKGFLLTPTKAYVDVHGLGEGIAKINSKTTVQLDVKLDVI